MKRVNTYVLFVILSSSLSLFAQKYELEEATLDECSVGATIPGYSGTGYVADFDRYSTVTVKVDVEKNGEYDLYLCYELTSDIERVIVFEINGKDRYSLGTLPNPESFVESNHLRIVLQTGENTIALTTGRNTVYNLDYIRLVKYAFVLDPVKEVNNKDAISEVKELYDYFLSVYGKHIISGQTEFQYCEFISGVTGKSPVICAFDFMDFTSNKNLTVDKAIEWNKEHKGIVAFQWHWRDPMTKNGSFYGFGPNYPNGTKFDVSKIFEPESPEYQAMMEDIDWIASHLKKLQDNNIPVLWRPLHEATGNQWGGWFWWSTATNNPAASCKKLWEVMHDRMTNFHGLNNLLWTWNTEGTSREDIWYPGDDTVDLLGTDTYDGVPNGAWAQRFEAIHLRHNGKKMIAMTENGSVPDSKSLYENNVPWLYFCTWGNMIMDQELNPRGVLRRVFNDPYVITNPKLNVDTILDPVNKPTLPGAYEAEDALLSGTLKVFKVYDGYTGSGYVGSFSDDSDKITFKINSDRTGDSELYIAYHITKGWGYKDLYVSINGVNPIEVRLENKDDEDFHETPPLTIRLNRGQNEIVLSKFWGYHDIDYIRLPGLNVSIDQISVEADKVWINGRELHFFLPDAEQIYSIRIISPDGRLLHQADIAEASLSGSILLPPLVNGVYIVNMVTAKGNLSFKMNVFTD